MLPATSPARPPKSNFAERVLVSFLAPNCMTNTLHIGRVRGKKNHSSTVLKPPDFRGLVRDCLWGYLVHFSQNTVQGLSIYLEGLKPHSAKTYLPENQTTALPLCVLETFS